MILKIDFQRYTDKDASVLSLKKKNKKNKKTKQTKERSYDLFNMFLLTITSFSFDIFFDKQLQNVCVHILWNFA